MLNATLRDTSENLGLEYCDMASTYWTSMHECFVFVGRGLLEHMLDSYCFHEIKIHLPYSTKLTNSYAPFAPQDSVGTTQ